MKIKFLAIFGLAAVLGFGACKSSTNTNTNTNTMMNVATPTPVVKTTESATIDPNMKAKIQDALNKKGFTKVTVESMGGDAVLRGTYPKGKVAEVMMTAQEAAGKPVKNEATEEK